MMCAFPSSCSNPWHRHPCNTLGVAVAGERWADRNRQRRELFDAQDAIDAQRDELIGGIEKQLGQRHTLEPVFAFRWRLT